MSESIRAWALRMNDERKVWMDFEESYVAPRCFLVTAPENTPSYAFIDHQISEMPEISLDNWVRVANRYYFETEEQAVIFKLKVNYG